MTTDQLLNNINKEDQTVAQVIKQIIPEISALVNATVPDMMDEGRLFYIGSGTSGRLGIVDASECPPTFGVSHGKVLGIIAGGDKAIRKAVEHAEDDRNQGWQDLKTLNIGTKDTVVGIAASGRTPYVLGALETCQKNNIRTACITCNPGAEIINYADFPIVAEVGPEFVTGSTRMKAGTAQKLILNMVSTSIMIKLGHVQDNKMVDMQLSNAKLIERGTRMISEVLNIEAVLAEKLLLKHGSVRKAINAFTNKGN